MKDRVKKDQWNSESWYLNLSPNGQCVADLIFKYHRYFSTQDKKYRRIVRALKVSLLVLAMISTIVLGLTTWIDKNVQVNVGLIISALITFVTAISSYFNFEEYWMRNISIHIQLNILRDKIRLDIDSGKLSEEKIGEYMGELTKIQEGNISYWEKAIKRI